MKPEKQDWQCRFLDEERLAIIAAAPSPLPEPLILTLRPFAPATDITSSRLSVSVKTRAGFERDRHLLAVEI